MRRYGGGVDALYIPPPRSLRALNLIGISREATQGQVRDAEFHGLTESVISHHVAKWREHGFVISERHGGTGIARLRLTSRGRDLLVERGIAAKKDLFVPKRALPLKDAAHHFWIVDLIVLARRGVPFPVDEIVPSWLLQRRIVPAPAAVPDLLLIRRPTHDGGGRLLAYEVDYSGGERINAVLRPRLEKLAAVMQDWSGGAPWGVVVFTRGTRRRGALEKALEDANLAETIAVELLPAATGRETLACLGRLLAARLPLSERPKVD